MHEVTTTDPARVGVSLSYKVNMGNYENLNVSFSVSASARKNESVDEAMDRVFAKVEEKLVAKVAEVKAALGE